MKSHRFFLVVLFLFVPIIIFAQSKTPTNILYQIDDAVKSKKFNEVENILKRNNSTPYSDDLESYVLRKSRQFVVQNDLGTAKTLCLAVIDSNLDNLEAVNLYQSIDTAYQKQEQEQKKQAQEQAVESLKQQTTEAKIKQDAEKRYQAIASPSGGRKVYLDQSFNAHYSTTTWDVMFGIANVNNLFYPDSDFLVLNYGLALSTSLFYRGEVFSIGADIKGDANVFTFLGERSVNWSASGTLMLINSNLAKCLALRAGCYFVSYNTGDNEDETNFLTPTAGLGISGAKIGEVGFFDFFVDWHAAHLYIDDVTVSLAAGMGYTFYLAQMQDFDIFIKIGAFNAFAINNSEIQNDASITLSFGVGNYD